MSNPSFDNIDKWLFEYAEGNLSSSQETQLKQFLLQNPRLEQDLEAWQFAKVEPSNVVYPQLDKHIKKPIAWKIPVLVSTTLLFSGMVGWFSWNNLHRASITFSEAAHSIGNHAIETNAFKAENYYLAKKQANKKSNDFELPEIQSIGMSDLPILDCQSLFDISTSLNLQQSNNGMYGVQLRVETTDNQFKGMNEQENQSKKNTAVAGKTDGLTEQTALSESFEVETKTDKKIASNYNSSFSSRAKSFLRKVVRMTENPIALRNSKDIYYHVPGLQTLDVGFGTAGSLLRTRVQSISRMQWTGHSQQQVSNQLSVDSYIKSIRGGIGVQINHSYYGNGEYQVGQLALIYSPKFTVAKNVVIEPAIRFKMGDKRLYNQHTLAGQAVELDRGSVRIVDNEGANSGTQNLWYKDVGLGIVGNTKWFSAGFQIDNLGKHYNNAFNSTDSQNRAKNHLTATLGTDYVSRTKLFSFSPYLMYQKVENLSEIWGGSIFRYKKITLGGGYSSLGDYAGSFGIKTNRLMITYNADYSLSVLSNKRLFSQQLTVRILTNKGRNDQRMLNL